MKFKLEIKMGNDLMQDHHDVADALAIVLNKLRGGQESGIIRDPNGNTVGSFALIGHASRKNSRSAR